MRQVLTPPLASKPQGGQEMSACHSRGVLIDSRRCSEPRKTVTRWKLFIWIEKEARYQLQCERWLHRGDAMEHAVKLGAVKYFTVSYN